MSEGRFKGHEQGVAPPAVEGTASPAPAEDYFDPSTIELRAKASFARSGRERMEARAELGRRRGLVEAQRVNREKKAAAERSFKAKVKAIATMSQERLEGLEETPWYKALKPEKREIVDDAVHDAMMSGTAIFGEETYDEPDAGADNGEALNEWLDDDTGQVEDPTGRESLDEELLVDADALHLLVEDV